MQELVIVGLLHVATRRFESASMDCRASLAMTKSNDGRF